MVRRSPKQENNKRVAPPTRHPKTDGCCIRPRTKITRPIQPVRQWTRRKKNVWLLLMLCTASDRDGCCVESPKYENDAVCNATAQAPPCPSSRSPINRPYCANNDWFSSLFATVLGRRSDGSNARTRPKAITRITDTAPTKKTAHLTPQHLHNPNPSLPSSSPI